MVGEVILVMKPERNKIGEERNPLETYKKLVLEERFWEAREILEPIWRSSGNEEERSRLKNFNSDSSNNS